MGIGDRIKQVRLEHNMTQKQFASEFVIAQSYISEVEANKKMPAKLLIRNIADYFGLSEEWLVNGFGEPYKANLITTIDADFSALEKTVSYVIGYKLLAEFFASSCNLDSEIRDAFSNSDFEIVMNYFLSRYINARASFDSMDALIAEIQKAFPDFDSYRMNYYHELSRKRDEHLKGHESSALWKDTDNFERACSSSLPLDQKAALEAAVLSHRLFKTAPYEERK